MRVQKFEGKNMREVIERVKRTLGPDAVILSAQSTNRGLFATPVIEVTAGLADSVADSSARHAEPPSHLDELDVDRIVGPLKAEMRALRSWVRQQAESFIDERVSSEINALRASFEEMQKQALARPALPSFDEISVGAQLTARSESRLVALVGPCGVGKTTTLAKLASRDALLHGQHLALITTDVYRVGGVEQMQAYADMIGVPLDAIGEPEQLMRACRGLGDYDRVYIDTGGRSPHDIASLQELAFCMARVPELETHLCLAAGTTARQIDRELARYAFFRPTRIIFTKCDEADDLRELAFAPARAGIPVSHVTTGQRVPEDIEEVTTPRLLDLATRGQSALQVAA